MLSYYHAHTHTLQVLKDFLVCLFSDHAPYRTLVLQILSLLNSALPEVHFASIELLNYLLTCVTTPPHFKEETQPLQHVKKEAAIRKVAASVGLHCVLIRFGAACQDPSRPK